MMKVLAAEGQGGTVRIAKRNQSRRPFGRPLAFLAAAFFVGLSAVARAGTPPGSPGHLFVSGFSSDNVMEFDENGAFVRQFVPQGSGGLDAPTALTFGPNGNLFVCSSETFNVKEYDGADGTFVRDLIAPRIGGGDAVAEAGWLGRPWDLIFRPDGRLLVAGDYNRSILCFDATTGAWLSEFAIGGGLPEGLKFPHSMAIAGNGNVLVVDAENYELVEFHGTTGRLVRVLASGPPLSFPTGMAIGPNGNVYVGNYNTNSVLRFDGASGAFLGTFASGGGLTRPLRLSFGPNGNLLVSGRIDGIHGVMEYNGATGAAIGRFTDAVDPTSLTNPWGMTFKPPLPQPLPAPNVTGVSVSQVNACHGLSGLTVTGSDLDPGATVLLRQTGDPAGYTARVIGGGGASLTVDFDLNGGAGMPGGAWEVVVVNPDGQSATLAGALTVTPCRSARGRNLFVSTARNTSVSRGGVVEFDGETGRLLGWLVHDQLLASQSELHYGPTEMAFGPNGDLFVATGNSLEEFLAVVRFDGVTGQRVGAILPGAEGMESPMGLTFGPNGNLFVVDRIYNPGGPDWSAVFEFDGDTGEFIREFVPRGTCGLADARHPYFGPNSNLFVVSRLDTDFKGVFEFDGQTGACLGVFPAPGELPTWYVADAGISPVSGNLLVCKNCYFGQNATGCVDQYDSQSWAHLGPFNDPGAGGVISFSAMAWAPGGNLFIASDSGVLEFHGATGDFVGPFGSVQPTGSLVDHRDLAFRPIPADADADWDRDLRDFSGLQRCFSGDGAAVSGNCLMFDDDTDADVDADDLAAFTAAMTGPE